MDEVRITDIPVAILVRIPLTIASGIGDDWTIRYKDAIVLMVKNPVTVTVRQVAVVALVFLGKTKGWNFYSTDILIGIPIVIAPRYDRDSLWWTVKIQRSRDRSASCPERTFSTQAA